MDKGNMQVSMTKVSGLERRLEVTVPQETVASAVAQRLKSLARSARIKGFRPGKVPEAVLRRQYGGQLHAEAVSELMSSTFSAAVTQQNLRPAADPRIEPIQVTPGSELKYAAVFEVLPPITLKPLSELTVERPTAEVTEADLDAMLENMRRQKPEFTAVERPAELTDRVWIDFEGKIDGEIFPGGQGKDLKVILGTGAVLAELDAALLGATVGESKSVAARFPDDYAAKSVAGRDAQFEMTVKKIEAQRLPEIDEAFVRSFGMHEGGVEEFRAAVRSSMEREMNEAIHTRVRGQLLDALYASNPLELPRVLVDAQIRELQTQVLQRAGVQKIDRLPPREPYEEPARKRVALGLLMGEIVRTQQLKLDRSRVAARLDSVVSAYPDPDGMRRQYLQSREAMQQIESAALEDQALDWLLAQAKVTDQPSSFRELTGFDPQAVKG
jgi:trigger factor